MKVFLEVSDEDCVLCVYSMLLSLKLVLILRGGIHHEESVLLHHKFSFFL